MRKTFAMAIAVILVLLSLAPTQGFTNPRQIVLATTTSTQDSGLLDYLLPIAQQQLGLTIRVIAVGTGQAMKMGELGDADVLLVHARQAEDKFVAEGFGTVRRDVMYNQFVLVGPGIDPINVRGLSISEALQQIANEQQLFISRGDNSGTHMKELQLWETAQINPTGRWYLSIGQGMGPALIMASERQAYILTDQATFAAMKDRLDLDIMVAQDSLLHNPYGIIAVNPERQHHVNYQGALQLIDFFTDLATKELINGFTVNGEQLFFAP